MLYCQFSYHSDIFFVNVVTIGDDIKYPNFLQSCRWKTANFKNVQNASHLIFFLMCDMVTFLRSKTRCLVKTVVTMGAFIITRIEKKQLCISFTILKSALWISNQRFRKHSERSYPFLGQVKQNVCNWEWKSRVERIRRADIYFYIYSHENSLVLNIMFSKFPNIF